MSSKSFFTFTPPNNLTRAKLFNCPYCSNKTIDVIINPQEPPQKLHEEYSKNNKTSIENYSKGSATPLLWRCNLQHEWSAPMKTRYKGKNYPYCSNNKINGDYNSLELMKPIIASELNNKNFLNASQIYYKSTKKYLWNCFNCLGVYQGSVKSRVVSTEECPNCFSKKAVSKREKELLKFIKNIYKGEVIENDRKILKGKELDIYLPELRIAFEFSRDYWNSTQFKNNKNNEDIIEKHLYRLHHCAHKNIKLYFVWGE